MSIRRTRQTLRSRYRSRTAARRKPTGRNNPPAVNAMIAQLASAEGALTSAEGLATARHCGARKTELSVRLGVLKQLVGHGVEIGAGASNTPEVDAVITQLVRPECTLVSLEGVAEGRRAATRQTEAALRIRVLTLLEAHGFDIPDDAGLMRSLQSEKCSADDAWAKNIDNEVARVIGELGWDVLSREELNKARKRFKREHRKRDGKCVDCPDADVKDALAGRTRCAQCRDDHRTRNQRGRAERRNAHKRRAGQRKCRAGVRRGQARRTTNKYMKSALRALHAAHERETRTLRAHGRTALGAALRALSATAYANSDHAWRTRKRPMALYHRSVAIMAKRVARTLTRAERTGRGTRRMRRERAAKQLERRERTLSVARAPHEAGGATRSGSVELNAKWREIFARIKDEELRSVCAALRAVHRDEGGRADDGGDRSRCFIASRPCTPDTCDAQRRRRSRARRSPASKNIANERGRVSRKQRTKKRCARTGNEQPRQRGRSRRTAGGPT